MILSQNSDLVLNSLNDRPYYECFISDSIKMLLIFKRFINKNVAHFNSSNERESILITN